MIENKGHFFDGFMEIFGYTRVDNPTYIISEENGKKQLECLICGHKSLYDVDVDMKYCSNCKMFHED